MGDDAGAFRPAMVTRARRKAGGFAGFGLALLAAQLGQLVLQRLDQPLNVLGRHLDSGSGDGQAGRCLGRVLQALPVRDARADAGELE